MNLAETIKLTTTDKHQLGAFKAIPPDRPRGGLVVIQDFLGLSPYIESVCDHYAAEGYAVTAPALYDRQDPGIRFGREPNDMARAGEMRKQLRWDQVMADVDAAREELTPFGECGIIGFCMGGSVAWLAASHKGFAAAISYYGKDVPDWLDKKPLCPVVLHFGERDNLIPMSGVAAVRAAFPDQQIYTYDAGHGFDSPATDTDPSIVALARQRTLDCLRQHIG